MLAEAIDKLKLDEISLYRDNEKLLSTLEEQLFDDTGVVKEHMRLVRQSEDLFESRNLIEVMLDKQVTIINSLWSIPKIFHAFIMISHSAVINIRLFISYLLPFFLWLFLL